jgi:hypothetical protein
MKVLKIAVAVLLAFCLVGCGNGGARPRTKKTTKAQPTTTPSTTTPSATTQPSDTTKPAGTTTPAETAKPGETTKPAETAKPAETPKPGETLVSKPSGFENEDIGGKSIGYWVEKLNSKNKEELLEAIECCKMVGGKASLGTAKLNDLTKNADPDIAKAANDALHAVRTVKP